MERWKGKVALVTGGSKGIGFAITNALVDQGLIVYACARNIEPIIEASKQSIDKPGKLFGIKCDLEKEDQILQMFAQIKEESNGVDLLVNNAGFSIRGKILSAETSEIKSMTAVNILAVSICCREAVKQMQEKNSDGQIININSSSGHRVSSNADLHFYSATKFALTALTQGLREELKQIKSSIRVTSLSPGMTETEGLDLFMSKEEKEKTKQKIGGIVMDPKDVAAAVVSVLNFPSHLQVHELHIRPLWH